MPLKVCTYDCPYCQVGATTTRTLERREYVPVDAVLAEFDRWLSSDGQADCVTLAGGGEPTLHSRFGEVIDAIGSRSSLRRILLSNGSLFSLPEVRSAAAKADVVKATLGAWDQESFEKAHHPHPDLRFAVFIEGLKAMRQAFRGEYWLEVFAVPGVNDSPEQMARIAALARSIAPDHIHLNTAVRPAQDGHTLPVPGDRLEAFARLFTPVAEVVGVAAVPEQSPPHSRPAEALADRILSLIQRHPSTVEDIVSTLGLPAGEVEAALSGLVEQGHLRREHRGTRDYFASSSEH